MKTITSPDVDIAKDLFFLIFQNVYGKALTTYYRKTILTKALLPL